MNAKKIKFCCSIILSLIILLAKGQSACSKTIFNCNADLTQEQFPESSINVIINISYAKPGATSIAPDASYVNECWQGIACRKDGSNLKFDVYYPSSEVHNYSQCKLPVIFLIHPGGFSECSSKDQPGIVLYSKELAKRGFVVFNTEYRVGHKLDPDLSRKSASYILSMYRGFQDLRGAIRSAIAMQAQGLFTSFSFDTAYIFLGGAGTVPMNTAYYNQQMMDEIVPELKTSLGPLNANYYFGDTTVKYRISGVMNLWGSAMASLNNNFAQHFLNKEIAPLISFHGVLDENSRYDFENILFSKAPYHADSTCLENNAPALILEKGNDNRIDMKTYGSQYIYDFFKNNLRIPTELYLDCHMHHGLDDNSGFGIGTTDIPTVQKYIIQRVVSFFQAVVSGRASRLKTTRFVNCENYRYGCTTRDNHNYCNKDSICPLEDSYTTVIEKQLHAVPFFTVVHHEKNTIRITQEYPQQATLLIYDYYGILKDKVSTQNKDTYIRLTPSAGNIYIIQMVRKKESASIIYKDPE